MKKVFLIDYDQCSPHSCGRPCVSKCPIVISNSRKKAHEKKAEEPIRYKKSTDLMIIISEYCIQCGICLNICPRKAIYSLFLLDEPERELITHEYFPGADSPGFRLYGLPTLLPGRVTGLCGPNGIGKSTVLNILAGDTVPNFGEKLSSPEKASPKENLEGILKHFKENEMRTHFREIFNGNRQVAYKRQVLRVLFDQYKGQTVLAILTSQAKIDPIFRQRVFDDLDIAPIANRYLDQCSGGELQRFAIALILLQKADVYLIDEPCTFLDVKKRIKLAELLQDRSRGLSSSEKEEYAILVVEHDLAILDYISDAVHLFYGRPHEFGVLTRVQTTKAGINAYLDGYLKTENIQFRKKKIGFRHTVANRSWDGAKIFVEFPALTKSFNDFQLKISPGTIFEGEILGIVGENGLGKSTFAKLLVGELESDQREPITDREVFVAYKPQYIVKEVPGTVKDFIMDRSQNFDFSDAMVQILYAPMGVDGIFEKNIADLSGGELQRVYICACLATRANLYILDEPSAYLDVEERLHIGGVIRSMTKHSNATTICIEHDIQIADALADRLMIFHGTPGILGETIGPLTKHAGMNAFLQILDITFRRDEDTGRAKINKKGSSVDKRQRSENEYFYSK